MPNLTETINKTFKAGKNGDLNAYREILSLFTDQLEKCKRYARNNALYLRGIQELQNKNIKL